jgi:hypothetical protein
LSYLDPGGWKPAASLEMSCDKHNSATVNQWRQFSAYRFRQAINPF